jgi:hypothetical protein
MRWKNINKHLKPFGHGDPNEENKYIFYALVFILVATFLYILTFYFKQPVK